MLSLTLIDRILFISSSISLLSLICETPFFHFIASFSPFHSIVMQNLGVHRKRKNKKTRFTLIIYFNVEADTCHYYVSCHSSLGFVFAAKFIWMIMYIYYYIIYINRLKRFVLNIEHAKETRKKRKRKETENRKN